MLGSVFDCQIFLLRDAWFIIVVVFVVVATISIIVIYIQYYILIDNVTKHNLHNIIYI
jgi:hypothetical protein